MELRIDPETLKENERVNERLEKIKEELIELKNQISNIRKEGKDTKTLEVMLINIGPKIRMANITKNMIDVEKIFILVEDIKKEIDEAIEGDKFSMALDIIDEIGVALNRDNFEEAKELYVKLSKLYRQLTEDQRKLLYPTSIDMMSRIAEEKSSEI